ncbi:MAG: class I SAM-dependent methyltransferase [Dissulfurispiraceae bacterium]
MTDFSESNWANANFSKDYRDNADIYIVERKRQFDILRSFYKYFLQKNRHKTILDLGCGDGIVIHELLKVEESISATLVDGSEDMLCKARERLAAFDNMHFIRASFQEILVKDMLPHKYDFIVSSQAIHHLTAEERVSLFGKIHSHLHDDGYFINIDVVLAPTDVLEQWYLHLWKEWIDQRKAASGIKGNYLADITQRYKNNKDNKPDTLDAQIAAMKSIGFKDVDCFYKYGIFSIYGGGK